MFPVQGWLSLGPHIELPIGDPGAEPSALGGSMLRDVETGPHLADVHDRDELRRRKVEVGKVVQVTVDPDPDPGVIVVDLEMDVAGAGRHRFEQDRIEERDRGGFGAVFLGPGYRRWSFQGTLCPPLPCQLNRSIEPLVVGGGNQEALDRLGSHRPGESRGRGERVEGRNHHGVVVAADRDHVVELAEPGRELQRQRRIEVGKQGAPVHEGQLHLGGQGPKDLPLLHPIAALEHLGEDLAGGPGFLVRRREIGRVGEPARHQSLPDAPAQLPEPGRHLVVQGGAIPGPGRDQLLRDAALELGERQSVDHRKWLLAPDLRGRSPRNGEGRVKGFPGLRPTRH